MTIEDSIRNLALKNAIDFKGKANPKAILGKILGEYAEWREKRAELMEKLNSIVAEVNALSPEEQKSLLEKEAPDMLVKKEKKERDIFAFLGIKDGEKVVTAFPPGPEKYPHIGHAKASLLNYLLAKQKGGKFILRFEDTNPKLVRSVFYDIIQENLKWLGAKWDKVIYASDYMDLICKHCKTLLESGDCYVCNCAGEKIKLSREKGIPCDCRERSPEENLELWENMPAVPVGHAIVRMKIDLKHKNSTMRDPTIFRIIDDAHARHGEKYRVWPNYDFQNAILDGELGITHRLRSKEFELRSELQTYLQNLLGYKPTITYEFGRFNLSGVLSSGRVIREAVEKGELLGWDDPSLTTIVALKRRGFLPEAIKNFVLSTGMSKAEATLTWDDLIMHNKRLLDAEVNRYFFVADPVELQVNGAPEQNVELNLHPDKKEGGRKFKTKDIFCIAKKDFDGLKDSSLYRLMDCLNFRKQKDSFLFEDLSVETFKKEGKQILHWIPKSDNLIPADILMPDKKIISGICEQTVSHLKEGDIVQFERFGFCRFDKKELIEDDKQKLIFWFTHK